MPEPRVMAPRATTTNPDQAHDAALDADTTRLDIPALIARLTLKEKAELLDGSDFWHTQPAAGLASSRDASLLTRVGEANGRESRAEHVAVGGSHLLGRGGGRRHPARQHAGRDAAFAHPWTKRVTGNNTVAIGHFGTAGYIISGATDRPSARRAAPRRR
ncbi:hypothetical protein OG302_02205 [Streptomyces sp. NBC_01283]|uniref:hypothetical protein n=1 Tax=Streptomyces sp. NBC_01283 TaxID=2903812 RepID=UPI00352DAE4A|nr:hypothetical protein OG302_02205 [Streptomyces sp. NBC_01283]